MRARCVQCGSLHSRLSVIVLFWIDRRLVSGRRKAGGKGRGGMAWQRAWCMPCHFYSSHAAAPRAGRTMMLLPVNFFYLASGRPPFLPGDAGTLPLCAFLQTILLPSPFASSPLTRPVLVAARIYHPTTAYSNFLYLPFSDLAYFLPAYRTPFSGWAFYYNETGISVIVRHSSASCRKRAHCG